MGSTVYPLWHQPFGMLISNDSSVLHHCQPDPGPAFDWRVPCSTWLTIANKSYSAGFCGTYCKDGDNCNGNRVCSHLGQCECQADVTCNGNGLCNDAGECQCKPYYYTGHSNCSTYCKADVTCNGFGNCSDAGECVCEQTFHTKHCLGLFELATRVICVVIFTLFCLSMARWARTARSHQHGSGIGTEEKELEITGSDTSPMVVQTANNTPFSRLFHVLHLWSCWCCRDSYNDTAYSDTTGETVKMRFGRSACCVEKAAACTCAGAQAVPRLRRDLSRGACVPF